MKQLHSGYVSYLLKEVRSIGTKAIIINWLAFAGAVALLFWKPTNAESDWYEYVLVFLTFATATLVTIVPYLFQKRLKLTPDIQKELDNKNDSERIDYFMERGIARKDAEIMIKIYNNQVKSK